MLIKHSFRVEEERAAQISPKEGTNNDIVCV